MKAKQRGRAVEHLDIARLMEGCDHLRRAVSKFRAAKAGNAANYVARALKSAQGALSNAQRMLAKQERAARENSV